MMKRMMSIFMCVLAASVYGVETQVVDSVTWSYETNATTARIVRPVDADLLGKWLALSGKITTPSVLGQKPVSEIGCEAFRGCADLSAVMLADGVRTIGESAFYGCSSLVSVDFPSSLTNIDAAAFADCTSLESVVIPGNVETLGVNGLRVTVDVIRISEGGVTVTESVPHYDSAVGVFQGCASLRTAVISPGVSEIGFRAFRQCTALASIDVPSSVRAIYQGAFAKCTALMDVVLHDGLQILGVCVLDEIVGRTITRFVGGVTVTESIPEWTRSPLIEDGVFFGCTSLRGFTVPVSVVGLGDSAFAGCWALRRLRFEGNKPKVSGWTVLSGTSDDLVVDVRKVAQGWYDSGTYGPLATWQGRAVTYDGVVLAVEDPTVDVQAVIESLCNMGVFLEVVGATLTPKESLEYLEWGRSLVERYPECLSAYTEFLKKLGVTLTPAETQSLAIWAQSLVSRQAAGRTQPPESAAPNAVSISLTATNVVIHYIKTSEVAELTEPISQDVAIVNVMTEVKGGTIAVPESWADNCPGFVAKFGSDFSAALTKPTGKRDAFGAPLLVWQDFVAGTDPTDETSVFKASVTMVDGKPVVSWTPELPPEQAARRKYTTYGKVKLQDVEWSVVNGDEANYNFFKVSVEMR